jgi:hypothetical protein
MQQYLMLSSIDASTCLSKPFHAGNYLASIIKGFKIKSQILFGVQNLLDIKKER